LFTVGVTEARGGWYEPVPVPRDQRNYPEFVSWVRGIFATMDFALAPLVDTSFNLAKSDLKFLEYSAAKLPCMASDVGPYRGTIKHGETGLLVDNTTASWTEQLRFAANNPSALAQMAAKAHAEVVSRRLTRHRESFLDSAVLSALRGSVPAR
jgi:glycosyltransferase involved in cell wall biosynthesis